ncbi:MAG: VOC family protein [Pegethrix bostrychoides GSE-TBD4-15B]|jgi:catechol 2,3-dioxygenase-like lactoylglutathione lyase family enzyme|uniref:VOC family protein n=1 Tax=Pegethrix bostrychoides GSE-TBD4-15B TaxID=2839662 RepID=A0A951PCF8_9CYAN|nr:VOC family protein [Pegethrix bostrychoides GSE-TBD4-15B]
MHHASIRTADIHRAIAFYQRLGFEISEQFTAGITLACWMEGWGGRIELLQVPEPRPAADAFNDEQYTGYYHLSFDLSDQTTDLTDWLAALKARFEQDAEAGLGEPLKILLEPTQQMIGRSVYEVAFIADTDGLPLEFLRMLEPVKAL